MNSETLKFSTSINCNNCRMKVSATLNRLAGQGNWEVDTNHPQKILTVSPASCTSNDIINGLSAIGFSARILED